MRVLAAVLLALLAAGCASDDATPPEPSAQASPEPSRTTPSPPRSSTSSATRSPRPAATRPPDPRWRFFTTDTRRHASPWFAGRHRVMTPFGCTPAPYYSPDPSCADGRDLEKRRGFHHGIDVAIPCGTPLMTGRAARVLNHGALGPAYGATPVLLRVDGLDVVIGHTRQVFVEPGDRVRPGRAFARVSDSGAPDGCHLHFEVRRPGGGVLDAVDPAPLLALRP